MANIIDFKEKYQVSEDGLIHLSELQSAYVALDLYKKFITDSTTNTDSEFSEALDTKSKNKLNRWLCAINCMVIADLPYEKITKIVLEVAKTHQEFLTS